MAFSAYEDPEHIREFESDPETLDRQAAQLADLIRQSRHFIAFTGAGISTSAGIPDFRGPQGVWTLRAQGQYTMPANRRQSTLSAVPTAGHMALVALQQANKLKFLVSQNTDGLHRRSGFPPSLLSELHGNSNLEVCKHCGKEYLRDFSTRSGNTDVHDHRTTRNCSVCGHPLYDTIINFSESLPEKPLRAAFANARMADLCLVLGSSLTVSPANRIPEEVANHGGKLVICNLQKTPLDSIATIRIFAKTNALMEKLMPKLGMPILEWVHRRWVKCTLVRGNPTTLSIVGTEPDGTPATILRKVELLNTGQSCQAEPFNFPLGMKEKGEVLFKLRLHFMGHYNEPVAALDVAFTDKADHKIFRMEFTLSRMEWTIVEEK